MITKENSNISKESFNKNLQSAYKSTLYSMKCLCSNHDEFMYLNGKLDCITEIYSRLNNFDLFKSRRILNSYAYKEDVIEKLLKKEEL